ncbi:hypothetical protein [Thermus scotoductus]|nr:hypothetical protein [Thermus scotoductus]
MENLFGRLKVKVAYPGEAAEREARAQALGSRPERPPVFLRLY